MRYVSLQKWNMEYAGKLPNPRLFYNPDNSVAIFDAGDEDVWEYILEHGERLKETQFYMNQGNYEAIQEYLRNNKKEVAAPEKAVSVEEPKKALDKNKVKELLESLEKPTVAKVAEALKEVISALSK